MSGSNLELVYGVVKVHNAIEFYNYAKTLNEQCLAARRSLTTGAAYGADDDQIYYEATLGRTINLRTMTDEDLDALYQQSINGSLRKVSMNIILAPSIEAFADSYTPEFGDTLILPNGIYQYGEDSAFHQVVNQEKMDETLPAELIPRTTTKTRILTSRSDPNYKNSTDEDNINAYTLTTALQVAPNKKIIRSNSMQKIDEAGCTIEPGDTIILPDKIVRCIDQAKLETVVEQADMANIIPARFIPDENFGIKVYQCRTDEEHRQDQKDQQTALRLTLALNTSLQDNNDAMYVGEAALEYRATMLSSAVSSLAGKEINRRKLTDNLILQVLDCKNDRAFMSYWEQIKPQEKLDTDALRSHITNALQQKAKLNLSSLSDTQLTTLTDQCDIWVPNLSSRLIVAAKLPRDYHINDTVILPDGLYQMRVDQNGKIKKHRIMNAAALQQYHVLPRPNRTTTTTIYDNYTQQPALDLVRNLNTIIIKNRKGIYLATQPERTSESFLVISSVLQELAEQELATRLAQRAPSKPEKRSMFSSFLGFFGLGHKAAPAPSPTSSQTTTIRHQKPAEQFRSRVSHLKRAQATEPYEHKTAIHDLMINTQKSMQHPRTFEDLQSAIQSVLTELEGISGNDTYETHQDNADKPTISIVDKSNQKLLLKASTHSLVVYKPLLNSRLPQQHAADANEKKAELFLSALGIPPTHGKQLRNIRGGNHALREAIREKFREYKEIEQLQPSTQDNWQSLSSPGGKRK